MAESGLESRPIRPIDVDRLMRETIESLRPKDSDKK